MSEAPDHINERLKRIESMQTDIDQKLALLLEKMATIGVGDVSSLTGVLQTYTNSLRDAIKDFKTTENERVIKPI